MLECKYAIASGTAKTISADCDKVYVRYSNGMLGYSLPDDAFSGRSAEMSPAWFKPVVYFKLHAIIDSSMEIHLAGDDGRPLVPQPKGFPLKGEKN